MRSLSVRVPVLAAAVLAVSVVLTVVIGYQLLVLAGERDLDRAMTAERDRFERSLARTRDEEGAGAPLRLRRAAAEYLALHPPTETYLIVLRIDEDLLSTSGGPGELVAMRDAGTLPEGEPGALATIGTDVGPVRVMTSRVLLGQQEAAQFQVYAPLQPVRDSALEEVRALALAGGLSVLVGGVLLAVVLRRALAPLRSLARATTSIELGAATRSRFSTEKAPEEVALLAAELNGMLDRLDEAVRARQELFAATSHELRTPITIALGCIDTAASPSPETLATVRQELVAMGRLVDDLMTLARAEAPDFVELRPVEVLELVDDLRLRAAGRSMDGVSFGPVPDVVVRADQGRLEQALLNLLVNARVHNPPGTEIEVGAELRGADLALLVRDRGRGIHPVVREHVLEPFVRGPVEDGVSSTGLGLAVVAAVTEAHHGEVEIASGPEGTTVTLLVPVR
jgi:signal transduction histidine kinase